MKKKNDRGFFAVIGIVAIVLAVVCLLMSSGSHESYKTYGGDAYTGMQQAAAQTANNIQDLIAVVKFGFSSVLLVTGLLSLAYAKGGKKEEQAPFFTGYVAQQTPAYQAPQPVVQPNAYVAPQPVNQPVTGAPNQTL